MRLPVLDEIAIASPCPMRWEQLTPVAERVRFCGQCRKRVYDLSSMPEDEIRNLLDQHDDVCGMLLQRADGSVIVGDCPVGKRHARERLVQVWTRFVAAIRFLFGTMALAGMREARWTQSLRRSVQLTVAPTPQQVEPQGRAGTPARAVQNAIDAGPRCSIGKIIPPDWGD